jgi:hypothetical protein
MKIDVPAVRACLKSFAFATLFREQLGWDKHQAHLDVPVDGNSIRLTAIAQKRGFTAYVCTSIPDRPTRLKIDRQVTKTAREHFVIYTEQSTGHQVWHWVRREPGKPLASRDHRFDASQSGDPLIQRLEQIAIGIDEEEQLTLFEVTGKTKSAFDVDTVTKKFYERFKAEHAAFLKFIKGIKATADLEWYTSLMLNRLMFVYFIQKKGFLDGDTGYLRDRMKKVRELKGKDKFQSFYRYFLLTLFHDGLGKAPEDRKLDRELEKLLGKVPYLNGGFFEVHQLEEQNPNIDIPDKAFEKLFDFFDDFRWHLDERPLRASNEINPDVVGYIFEKYINQKQMGAYYTKEDITEYISKNTVIRFLFDAAEKKCPIAFKPGSFLWRLLSDNPDRYIYAAVRKGVIDEAGDVIRLPKEIEAGVTNVAKRDGWNKPAPEPFAQPTETWREHVARRTRCLELRDKLKAGEVHSINDLITLNLDIWQFARDAIVNSEGPELLRAFWQSIEKVTVLDPTCGSGAFLFAALRILETLYSDCLERMARFVDDLAGKNHHPEKFSDFKSVLAQIAKHPSDRYFILKSIIINNLFGVDIMEEAVEICKLRLFLKLVAQVERAEQIEPLPDIDFNIRAGNTLVGYVSLDQLRRSQEGKLGFGSKGLARIEDEVLLVEKCFKQFRAQQTLHGGKVTATDKQNLRRRLARLDAQLDRYLAGEFSINPDDPNQLETWRAAEQPFHWFVEFYGIMLTGGFDVIVGNPPYVVYSEASSAYRLLLSELRTAPTKNLYAFVFERSIGLTRPGSPIGLIVQLTAVSSERLSALQDVLGKRGQLVVLPFPRRPESIFEGVEMPVVILLSMAGTPAEYLSARISRFYTLERATAMNSIRLTPHNTRLHGHRIAKFGNPLDIRVFSRLAKAKGIVDSLTSKAGDGVLYYQEACRYWLKAINGLPFFSRNGKRMEPPHGRVIHFRTKNAAAFVACLLNSSLFYWYYSAFSDCEHVNDILLRSFPVPENIVDDDWRKLAARLSKRLEQTASRKTIKTKQGHTIQYDEMKAAGAKDIIDEIDRAICNWYGFDADEIDSIINYDIKYRLGDAGETDE